MKNTMKNSFISRTGKESMYLFYSCGLELIDRLLFLNKTK